MRIILVITACLLILIVSVWSYYQFIKPQKPEVISEQKKGIAKYIGLVHVGMPKEDLYKVFGKTLEKDYHKKGNEEWITFSNWITKEPEDIVTFYLVNGKVSGWKEESGKRD